jgi:hypothetical protein
MEPEERASSKVGKPAVELTQPKRAKSPMEPGKPGADVAEEVGAVVSVPVG